MAVRKLPKNLKLGVATSAFQIEGAWNSADKSRSIWDIACHEPNYIKDGTTADDACKSYQFYKRDVEMVKFLQVDYYRFSISWPRLFPNGFTNEISHDGLSYYNNIINELLDHNIEPVVTMFHWDLPQKLQDLGGWTNPLIVDWFAEYARALYENFGDRVKTWVTINEPKLICLFGYGLDIFAPRVNASGIGEYISIKNTLMAHAKAWHVYDKEFREIQKGVCGLVIAANFAQPASDSESDQETSLDVLEFEIGLYSNPIFSSNGDFPERVKRRVAEKSCEQGFLKSRLPELTKQEIEYLKGASDFFGFNHYTTIHYTREGFEPTRVPSYEDDIGARTVYIDVEKGASNLCMVIPDGIRKCLNWVKENCNDPTIMIFENGFDTFGGLRDLDRISYYRKYLDAVLNAIEIDKCKITRYTAWSLMDNFEWNMGYSLKFGLFEVDFADENRKRTARYSALWYKQLAATRQLHSNYVPNFEGISF